MSTYFCQKLKIAPLESVRGSVCWVGGRGRGNDQKNFMINLHESYMAEQRFKLSAPEFAVRCATDCVWSLANHFYGTIYVLGSH